MGKVWFVATVLWLISACVDGPSQESLRTPLGNAPEKNDDVVGTQLEKETTTLGTPSSPTATVTMQVDSNIADFVISTPSVPVTGANLVDVVELFEFQADGKLIPVLQEVWATGGIPWQLELDRYYLVRQGPKLAIVPPLSEGDTAFDLTVVLSGIGTASARLMLSIVQQSGGLVLLQQGKIDMVALARAGLQIFDSVVASGDTTKEQLSSDGWDRLASAFVLANQLRDTRLSARDFLPANSYFSGGDYSYRNWLIRIEERDRKLQELSETDYQQQVDELKKGLDLLLSLFVVATIRVNAGEPQLVFEGDTVALDAKVLEGDSQAVTFRWSIDNITGSEIAMADVSLTDVTAKSPLFIAPEASADYAITFGLVASSGDVSSDKAQVVVSVQAFNDLPLVTVPGTVAAREGEAVSVTAQGTDPEGRPVTFAWTVESVSTPAISPAMIELQGAQAQTVGFVAPPHSQQYNVLLAVVANDGEKSSAKALVTVAVAAENSVPQADAGQDSMAVAGEIVTLDGSASHDADREALTYAWQVESVQGNSGLAPSDFNIMDPNAKTTFLSMLSSPQGYSVVVALTVQDLAGASSTARVTITVQPAPDASPLPSPSPSPDVGVPTADARPNVCAGHEALSAYNAIGFGSDMHPYVLCSAQQLVSLSIACDANSGTNPCAKSYRLGRSIDMQGVPVSPIGFGKGGFRGKFDGNHHSIQHLTLNSPNDEIGLFSILDSGARVSNLRLTNVAIVGGHRVGGLAGRIVHNVAASQCPQVFNIEVDGDIFGQGNVGGIAGLSNCSIERVKFQGNLTANGLLVGTGAGGIVGSLVGAGMKIQVAMASGSINGSGVGQVGGVAGVVDSATLQNVLSNLTIDGHQMNVGSCIGGLVGMATASKILTSLAAASITTTSEEPAVGGVAGCATGDQGSQNAFFDSDKLGSTTAHAVGSPIVAGMVGKTTAELYSTSTYGGFPIPRVWYQRTPNGAYPALSLLSNVCSSVATPSYNEIGLGTAGQPYVICSPGQWQTLAASCVTPGNCRDRIELGASLYLTDLESLAMVPYFEGILDGRGFEVQGIRISVGSEAALFKTLGNDAAIRNLALVGFQVSGTSPVAGLVSHSISNVEIFNVHVRGRVQAVGPHAGGVIGTTSGEGLLLVEVYSDVVVEHSQSEGLQFGGAGLVGSNVTYASVRDVRGRGEIKLTTDLPDTEFRLVGGLFGASAYSTISRVAIELTVTNADDRAIGTVGGIVGHCDYYLSFTDVAGYGTYDSDLAKTTHFGTLCGSASHMLSADRVLTNFVATTDSSSGGQVTPTLGGMVGTLVEDDTQGGHSFKDCFWNSELTKVSTDLGNGADHLGIRSVSSAAMKSAATFQGTGFDFSKTWALDSAQYFPRLLWAPPWQP